MSDGAGNQVVVSNNCLNWYLRHPLFFFYPIPRYSHTPEHMLPFPCGAWSSRDCTLIWICSNPGLCNDCFVYRIIITGIVLRSQFLIQYQHSQTGHHTLPSKYFLRYILYFCPSPCMYAKCEILLHWSRWWSGDGTLLSFQSSIDII